MTVDFATYCCHKDRDKLYDNLEEHIASHNYNFNKKLIIHQRVGILEDRIPEGCTAIKIEEDDYESILDRNLINPNNEEAEKFTHGWGHSHYWRHHCVNHLVALEESTADYIVMSDADCHMVEDNNWIDKGIEILKKNRDALVVSPSDGSAANKTDRMSQQLFICDRLRLQGIDFDTPFTGFTDGGPMQEYYFMLEGRIGRYMETHGMFRYMLGTDCRYWHKAWH